MGAFQYGAFFRHAGENNIIMHLTPAQEQQEDVFRDKDTGAELEVVNRQPLLEWLAENYKNVRCFLPTQCHTAACSAACSFLQ